MILLKAHRTLAALSCEDCRRYLCSDGQIVRDREGRPVEDRGERDCGRCPKQRPGWPNDDHIADIGKMMSEWRMCREFHCLPRSGGLLDQDAITMRAFEAFEDVEAEEMEEESKKRNR